MSAANWFIALGLFTVAAAGGGLAYRLHNAPPQAVTLTCPAPGAPVINVPAPVVNVTAPASKAVDTTAGVVKPYVCTPAQAEAGECLPLLKQSAGDVVHVMKKAPKKKPSAAKKLKSKWAAPPPFKLEDLFNGR